MSRSAYLLTVSALLLALASLAGCTPSIGDKCVLSTDCSIRGDRLCDTSQPAGYCTIFNCSGNSCPDEAACILFHGRVQGCAYDDHVISRTARTFCMAHCESDSDCRTADGYRCRDPRAQKWQGIILDDDQSRHVCIVDDGDPRALVSGGFDAGEPAPVCQASLPDASTDAPSGTDAGDAGLADAAKPDSGADSGSPDGGADAGVDAADAGADAADATAD